MAAGVFLGWLPFVGRSLSPDEAGYLIVGGQWGHGSSLYGDYWVDRPPALIAIFEAADALGGAVPLRLFGALAAVLTVVLSGVLGRFAAPERRSAPLLTAGTAAVCVATPLIGGTVVNGELLGLPFLVAGILAYVAAAASRHQVRGLPAQPGRGCGRGGRGTGQAEPGRRVRGGGRPGVHQRGGPAEVPRAAGRRADHNRDRRGGRVGSRHRARRPLGRRRHLPRSMRPASWPATAATPRPGWPSLVGALAASGVPLVVAAFAWKGRGDAVAAGTMDRARPAGRGLRPAHLRAARRVPGRQLLAALPDGAGARSRAVRGRVRAAAGAGDPEHRRLRSRWPASPPSPHSAGSAAHPVDRKEQPAIAYLEDHAQQGDSAVVVLRRRQRRSTTRASPRRTPISGACPPGSATPTWPPSTGCSRATCGRPG